MNLLKTEPALVLGVVAAIVNLIVGLGYLDATNGEAVLSVAESALLMLGAYLVRQKVTPVEDHFQARKARHD